MRTENQVAAPDNPQYEKKAQKSFAIRITICMIAGGILGFLCALSTDLLREKLTEIAKTIFLKLPMLQVYIFPWIMLVFSIVCVAINAFFIKKGKLQIATWDGEDNEHINIADSYLNKVSLISNIQLIIIQILFSIVTYNLMKHLQSKWDCIITFITVGIYFISLFSTVIQQNHLVKLAKQYAPEKKGSVYDIKFQDVWLASCDEGERHIIYEASFKTFRFMNKVFSICLTIAIIAGMFLPIGILCAVIIGILWLIMTCCYVRETTKLESRR